MEKLAELRKKDKDLFNWLKRFIVNFFNKITARYKKLTPTSVEAKLVQEIEGMSENLQKLFEDALLDAAENQRIVGAQKNTAQSGVKMQNRFTYDSLITKGDIKGTIIDKSIQLKFRSDGTIDTNWLVNYVKSQCKTLTTKSTEPTYYVSVANISRNVEITNKGLTHGINRKNKLENGKLPNNVIVNAESTLNLAETLANSIEVNQLNSRGNIDIPYSHVMLGVTGVEKNNGNVEYYAVRMIVEERANQNPILTETNVLGRLYAVNAKK